MTLETAQRPVSAIPSPILRDVVEEHFNEAEYLFNRWTRALKSPSYRLSELERTLEDRLAAHFDALLVNGPQVPERILHPELENAGEPSRATVAALAELYARRSDGVHRLLKLS